MSEELIGELRDAYENGNRSREVGVLLQRAADEIAWLRSEVEANYTPTHEVERLRSCYRQALAAVPAWPGIGRRTEPPHFYADKPDEWWAHVRGCKDCLRFYCPPDVLADTRAFVDRVAEAQGLTDSGLVRWPPTEAEWEAAGGAP